MHAIAVVFSKFLMAFAYFTSSMMECVLADRSKRLDLLEGQLTSQVSRIMMNYVLELSGCLDSRDC